MTPQYLIRYFKTTQWLIDNQAKDLSHEDSLLQPSFRANCMNWVLGHIAVSRDDALAALEEERLLSEDEVALYVRDSEPMTAGETAVPLSRLLSLINQSTNTIVQILQEQPDRLNNIIDPENQSTVADRLAGLHWHETYHTGQLELLRQLAGTNDKIV